LRRAFRDARNVAEFYIGGGADTGALHRAIGGKAEETFVFPWPKDAISCCAKFYRRAVGVGGVSEKHAAMRGRN